MTLGSTTSGSVFHLTTGSHPWRLGNEQAAAAARLHNSQLSEEELMRGLYSKNPPDQADYDIRWEERYYRLVMECYNSELGAYEHLEDLQGSVIPHLIMASRYLPSDERAIQLPALVFEYIPSVSLHDVSSSAITPAICAPIVEVIDSFASRGILHRDITDSNILFTPPERPVRAVLIDFAYSALRRQFKDEEMWMLNVGLESEPKWIRRLLAEKWIVIPKDASGSLELAVDSLER